MYNDNWTSNFVNDKLSNFSEIELISILSANRIEIKRNNGTSFTIFTMSLERINLNLIKDIVSAYPKIDMIVNIKKVYAIDGNAINFLLFKKISFGGMGDLMRFSAQELNSFIRDKEYDFVSRILRQHKNVTAFERIDNRRIRIKRPLLNDVDIIMVNEYEITAETVRENKDFYGEFRVIVKTNPNGGVTDKAIVVANSMNIDICKWGKFLSKLNSFWN